MIFKVFGIICKLDFYFLLCVAVFLLLDKSGFGVLFLWAAVIHEVGHIIAMWAVGDKISKVDFMPRGIYIKRGGNVSPINEIVILLGGCGINLICGTIFYFLGYLDFSAVNTALAVYHLMPVNGLDGWSVLEQASCLCFGSVVGERVAKIIAIIFMLGLVTVVLVGVFFYGLSPQLLILVGVVVAGLIGATG